MAKYIEREVLYRDLHNAGGCDASKNSWADGWDNGWDKGIDEAIRLLNNAPTADVVEVRHGEWKLRRIGHGHLWLCSCCNTDFLISSNYCPNCGADMRGVNNGKE